MLFPFCLAAVLSRRLFVSVFSVVVGNFKDVFLPMHYSWCKVPLSKWCRMFLFQVLTYCLTSLLTIGKKVSSDVNFENGCFFQFVKDVSGFCSLHVLNCSYLFLVLGEDLNCFSGSQRCKNFAAVGRSTVTDYVVANKQFSWCSVGISEKERERERERERADQQGRGGGWRPTGIKISYSGTRSEWTPSQCFGLEDPSWFLC